MDPRVRQVDTQNLFVTLVPKNGATQPIDGRKVGR